MTDNPDTTECLPPDGAPDGSTHWLSCEVGDASKRKHFVAAWRNGMWVLPNVQPLSPRKAAWATWQYERQTP